MPEFIKRGAWALCPLGLLLQAAWAQTAAPSSPSLTELPSVTVKGARPRDQSTLTQPDLPTARRRIETTPGGAAVIDPQTYTEGRVSTLSDALGGATGVFVQPRFGAEESRLSIRGSGLQRTFHGRGLKLMQDGVPLNLADGSFDFQAVEALSVRYVEVWRGANALQYGASTLGGAVNFVSPNGRNADRGRLRAEVGSFGYGRLHAAAANAVGPWDYHVAASGFTQEGFRDHAQQGTTRLSANLGLEVNPNLATRFYLGRVDSLSRLPGALTRAQLQSDAGQASANNLSGDQQRNITWTRLSNKTVYRDGPQRWELFAYASDKQLFHPIFQVIDQSSRDYGAELRFVRDDEWWDRQNHLTLGLAPSVGRTDEQRHVNTSGHATAQTNASRQTARNVEFYAENQHHLTTALALVLGVQHTHSVRQLDDRFLAAGTVDESFDKRYDSTSPKLGLLYQASRAVQFFANWSRSYEPPSFGELAGGATPVLNEAQKASTVEVGSRGAAMGVRWDVAVYESRLRDELLVVSTAPSVTTAVNADKTLHRGLELGLSSEAAPGATSGLEWRLNALWNDFRFRGDATYGDGQLPGLPKLFAKAELAWRFANGTRAGLTAEGAGGYPIDFASTYRAGGYGIWGVKLSGELRKGLGWFVDGRNLSDRRYAATTNVIRDAAGRDSPQFFPGDGRAVYAGLDWKFN